MSPTPESTGRNPLAEIDEIVRTMKTVLEAMANMGEEMIRYREAWNSTQEKLTPMMDVLGDSFGKQTELNESFNRIVTEAVQTITSLEERISALENGNRLIVIP